VGKNKRIAANIGWGILYIFSVQYAAGGFAAIFLCAVGNAVFLCWMRVGAGVESKSIIG
jgi:hypothetical protein